MYIHPAIAPFLRANALTGVVAAAILIAAIFLQPLGWLIAAGFAGALLGLSAMTERRPKEWLRPVASLLLLGCGIGLYWQLAPRPEVPPGYSGFMYNFHFVSELRGTPYFFLFPLLGWLVGVAAALIAGKRRGGLLVLLCLLATLLLTVPGGIVLSTLGISEALCEKLLWCRWHVAPYLIGYALLWAVLLGLLHLRREFRWKRFLLECGICAGFSLMVWGGADWFYRYRADRLLTDNPQLAMVPLSDREKQARELFNRTLTAYDAMREKTGEISPPMSSVRRWLNGEESEENRQKALAFDRLPETDAFYAAFDALLQDGTPLRFLEKDDLLQALGPLNHVREMQRRLAGRAELAHYFNREADILPWVKRTFLLADQFSGDPVMIATLIRYALYWIAIDSAVSLGPDGPAYATDYRTLLKQLDHAQPFRVAEPLYTASVLRNARRTALPGDNAEESQDRQQVDGVFDCSDLLFRPLQLRLLCRDLVQGLAMERDYPALCKRIERGEAFTLPELPAWRSIILKGSRISTEGKIGLALKIYRSEHGQYPASLSELVPAILPFIPRLAETGKEPEYKVENGNFTLGSGKSALSSVPDY